MHVHCSSCVAATIEERNSKGAERILFDGLEISIVVLTITHVNSNLTFNSTFNFTFFEMCWSRFRVRIVRVLEIMCEIVRKIDNIVRISLEFLNHSQCKHSQCKT